jgi:hypothetical protein
MNKSKQHYYSYTKIVNYVYGKEMFHDQRRGARILNKWNSTKGVSDIYDQTTITITVYKQAAKKYLYSWSSQLFLNTIPKGWKLLKYVATQLVCKNLWVLDFDCGSVLSLNSILENWFLVDGEK